jgi:hypothetical protein
MNETHRLSLDKDIGERGTGKIWERDSERDKVLEERDKDQPERQRERETGKIWERDKVLGEGQGPARETRTQEREGQARFGRDSERDKVPGERQGPSRMTARETGTSQRDRYQPERQRERRSQERDRDQPERQRERHDTCILLQKRRCKETIYGSVSVK